MNPLLLLVGFLLLFLREENQLFLVKEITTDAYLLSTELSLALVSLIGTGITECPIAVKLALLRRDLAGSFVNVRIGKGKGNAGSLSLEILSLETKIRGR